MQILTGIFDRMVLQRNSRSVSDAAFSGQCASSGAVEARVTQRGKAVKGLDWAKVGTAKGGKLSGKLAGVPSGGPYKIELRVTGKSGAAETLAVDDVLVGDVWVCGGQSNMYGCGRLTHALAGHKMVRAFYMIDRWDVAKDPIHDMFQCVDQVHADLSGGPPGRTTVIGVGPAVAFGQEMHKRTGVPQGLLACGHGGTSMAQWDPKLKGLGSKSLYGATCRRVKKNGGKVAGVIWYQGCSDTGPNESAVYTDRMKELVRSMRRDFGDPKLPFVAVQIAGLCSSRDGVLWNRVQDQQRRLPSVMKNCSVVPAIDLSMADGIHVSGKDQHVLGRRLAEAMAVMTQGRKAGLPPIALKGVTVSKPVVNQHTRVEVEFDNVVGKLTCTGRPWGFKIVESDMSNTENVFHIELEGNKAILFTGLGSLDVRTRNLYYGIGLWPYCNVRDEAGRSVPVLGPVAIGKQRALTDFIRSPEVSPLLPAEAGKIASLPYPDVASLGLARRTFSQSFCDMHAEIAASGPAAKVVYCRAVVRCPSKMKLMALVGFDGPVKVWVDGKPAYCNPNGANPALPDVGEAKFAAEVGDHEVLVALDTNGGKAWGVFLRIARTDVSAAAIAKGPTAYAMPEIV